MLLKTSSSLKALQDVVALKAERLQVDELVLGLKDVECGLHWKANQQSIVELNASVHELHRQLGLKAEKESVEQSKVEIVRVEEQLITKAGQQESHEMGTRLLAVERLVSQKADFSSLNDTRARFLSLEVNVEQKADKQEIGEVNSTVNSLREWTSRKVDQLISDFSQRPEAEALVAAEAALERLRQVSALKMDAETATLQFDEVTRKLEDVRSDLVRQLGCKVELASFEETVESLARNSSIGSPAAGSQRSSAYPSSAGSLSTVDSAAGRRSGKTLLRSGVSTPRSGRPGLKV